MYLLSHLLHIFSLLPLLFPLPSFPIRLCFPTQLICAFRVWKGYMQLPHKLHLL
jgi:hypothetical protein